MQVIDGGDALDSMEKVPVNAKNRPLNEIRTTHVRNPFSSYEPQRPRLVNSQPPRYQYAKMMTATRAHLPFSCLVQVTIHANPIADAQLVGR